MKTVLTRCAAAVACGLMITALCLGGALPAAAQGGPPTAEEGFRLFHDSFSTSAFLPPRHGAAPLGWVGFEVFVDASLASGFEDIERPAGGLDTELPEDGLVIGRIGVRKGLPGKFQIGVSYGEIFDADFDLVQAELAWSWLKGGAVTPAVAFRLSIAQSLGGDRFDFDQVGLDLSISKGFPLLTPYGGVALVRSESRLDRLDLLPNPVLEEESTEAVFFAGLRLNLLVPKITVAVEQGEEFQGVVRVSLGL